MKIYIKFAFVLVMAALVAMIGWFNAGGNASSLTELAVAGVLKEERKADADVSDCLHPQMSNPVEADVSDCLHPQMSNPVEADVSDCLHPQMSNPVEAMLADLEDIERFERLVEARRIYNQKRLRPFFEVLSGDKIEMVQDILCASYFVSLGSVIDGQDMSERARKSLLERRLRTVLDSEEYVKFKLYWP